MNARARDPQEWAYLTPSLPLGSPRQGTGSFQGTSALSPLQNHHPSASSDSRRSSTADSVRIGPRTTLTFSPPRANSGSSNTPSASPQRFQATHAQYLLSLAQGAGADSNSDVLPNSGIPVDDASSRNRTADPTMVIL